MFNSFADRMAQVIVDYSTKVQPNEKVAIISNPAAIPLIESVHDAVLRAGAHPMVQVNLPSLTERFLRHANDTQLDFLDPRALPLYEQADVLINIYAPTNTKSLSNADPQKQARSQAAQRPVIETYFRRFGEESLRFCICAWPTESGAQEAEMGLYEYSQFVHDACGLSQPDPIAYWQDFRAKQTKIAEWLKNKKHARIVGPGIDLSFDFADRLWISCHGEYNFPDGEIFTGPIESTVKGHVEFSYPTVYGGREVDGVKFTFKDGVVVEASAAKNEAYLLSQLNLDEGARRLGEFAIGTNFFIQKFTGNTLFDEKIGGTIHMAVGRSIPQSLGVNMSQIHWDMVHGMQDGGEIYIDGELIYKSGEFLLA